MILSPADGIITYIGQADTPIESGINNKSYNKVSVFLSIFDIHVNRVPASGTILTCNYIKGKFLNATLDKSSNENERNIITMKIKDNSKIIFVQIAGLIARRIMSNLTISQEVKLGDRFGIIKFGSRVDLYIPNNLKLFVAKGQRVIGGETIIADIKNNLDIEQAIIK